MLSQKCAILDVLRQLANSGPDAAVGDVRTTARGECQPRQTNGVRTVEPRNINADMSAYKDGPGLSYRPSRDAQTKSGWQDRANGIARADEEKPATPEPRNVVLPDGKMLLDGPSIEAELLHDLPFTLQGLSTTHLPFTDPAVLELPRTLPLPLISLLHTLAEPSLLYRSLSSFVQSSDEGLVGQSLRAAIGNELRSYLGLIATLEGEIRRAFTSVGGTESQGRIGKVGVTLKRCVVWIREATMGLRLMDMMVEGAKSRLSPSSGSSCTNDQ